MSKSQPSNNIICHAAGLSSDAKKAFNLIASPVLAALQSRKVGRAEC